ncbi:RNA-binding cell elongation regulator Jag/EloR [Macrococcoides caseolyticum]|uniref:RNA-binding protein KhpB n=1 Tax=Macrococcoides caseolyticum TaxID=69966 RepID=A0A855GZI2_9STAP|nr:RNA-binding cell elongation regulator Jag/EloR [Macrococcus caseolyticus]PKE21421.1 protein jag [Macrococcus caseolyticus]PKE26563.1 protein jag [Macrococcus caseolyticus]PKE59191.1 protein jag [Macrococcus caseolyticus]PKE65743.1 protein jag [Macrococcus caseolyticus]PKE69731.1 protein jag [Macrococcus caseolyticus]
MLEQTFIDITVEDAIKKGLDIMNVSESQVKIEVLNAGRKGIFGIGKQNAEVKLIVIDPEVKREKTIIPIIEQSSDKNIDETPKKNIEIKSNRKQQSLELVKKYVLQVIDAMGYEASMELIYKNKDEVIMNISSAEASRIIGRRGQVLNSLQVLAQNYFNHLEKGFTIITLDIENYREKRRETLQNLALNMSKKAIATGEPVKFEPMPNYERKIMHQILVKIDNIETYSEGREPHRYLVIRSR